MAGLVVEIECFVTPEEFTADHPFVVALVGNNNETLETVLFAGRINNPTSSSED